MEANFMYIMQGKHLSKITVKSISRLLQTVEFHITACQLDECEISLGNRLNVNLNPIIKGGPTEGGYLQIFETLLTSGLFEDNLETILAALEAAHDHIPVELPNLRKYVKLGLAIHFGLPQDYCLGDYDDIYEVKITHPIGDFDFIRGLVKNIYSKVLETLENLSNGGKDYEDYASLGFANAMLSIIQHLVYYLSESGEDDTDFQEYIRDINHVLDSMNDFEE